MPDGFRHKAAAAVFCRNFYDVCIIEFNRVIFLKTLNQLRACESATVVRLHGEGALRRRIMDMGITRGTTVFVRKTAPFGDPIEITVRGYELSVRRAEAAIIEVE